MAAQPVACEYVEQFATSVCGALATHAARIRLPRELWAPAAKLARRDGSCATAGAAANLSTMKRWINRLEPLDKSAILESPRRRQPL